MSCVGQALDEASPLLSTHRLDTCTEGLVVLGRKCIFVAAFNKLLGQPGALQKYYRALTKQAPPTGTLNASLGGSVCRIACLQHSFVKRMGRSVSHSCVSML